MMLMQSAPPRQKRHLCGTAKPLLEKNLQGLLKDGHERGAKAARIARTNHRPELGFRNRSQTAILAANEGFP